MDTSQIIALFEKYDPKLRAIAESFRPGDADDILQDVKFKMIRDGRLPDDEQHAYKVLRVAVRNKVRDYWRRERRRRTAAIENIDITDDSPTPSSIVGRKSLLARAYAALTGRERRVLQWHFLEGRSVRAVGRLLGVSPVTALKLIRQLGEKFRTFRRN